MGFVCEINKTCVLRTSVCVCVCVCVRTRLSASVWKPCVLLFTLVVILRFNYPERKYKYVDGEKEVESAGKRTSVDRKEEELLEQTAISRPQQSSCPWRNTREINRHTATKKPLRRELGIKIHITEESEGLVFFTLEVLVQRITRAHSASLCREATTTKVEHIFSFQVFFLFKYPQAAFRRPLIIIHLQPNTH